MRDFSAVDDDSSRRQQMTELYVDHHSWLQNWLRKKLGCSQRAADLAHDAFVRILTLTEPLNLKEPRAFLATTATRLLIDGARRRKVERAYLDALALHADEASIPSPEAIHAALQILERIARLLEGLPEKPRQAFLLHRLDGLTYSESPLIWGCPPVWSNSTWPASWCIATRHCMVRAILHERPA
ncbi:sigma-70 family RNA polymerase sigma factor [Pseudomonas syringae pv. actinidiae]|nr:RNA polymerase sigma factor [Pseudomonas syringae pv. actinidiae ICMP 18884]AOE55547.1 RNA polymerase subunit sigma [Pseudomonas syringae pv. actinidiae ICMP 18708]APP96407.1 RNA polymerase subunit sigma [Pseudomonas syringae pv. actinidiae]AYL79544.1 sigma-70 family RNA polymerase sigma factor [Pseudomonas syringae pv. actinidiae str. Shaanxi_M228]EPM66520.1 RNA polymerase sigma-70 family protein [Pseudomonas syringae pv. actinidiae ICMP 18886]EPN66636.1 RNA polymerase sigma-70 family prot